MHMVEGPACHRMSGHLHGVCGGGGAAGGGWWRGSGVVVGLGWWTRSGGGAGLRLRYYFKQLSWRSPCVGAGRRLRGRQARPWWLGLS